MRFSILFIPLAIALATGCARTTDTEVSDHVEAAAEPSGHADVHRFRIGALEAMALKDGDIRVANDGRTIAVGQPPDAVAALLDASGQATDTLSLSIQSLLVRTGDRIVLFDTGAADASFADAGRLPATLR